MFLAQKFFDLNNPALDKAISYCSRIRKQSKKEYAIAYLQSRLNGLPSPNRPKDLSYLGAQAVRMSIDQFLDGKGY